MPEESAVAHIDPEPLSPIALALLERQAEAMSRAIKRGRKGLPDLLKRQVRATMGRVWDIRQNRDRAAGGGDPDSSGGQETDDAGDNERHTAPVFDPKSDVAARAKVARELDQLDAVLRGRSLNRLLYTGEMLGRIRRQDPIRIRFAVNMARLNDHVERYEARILRHEGRLRWFYERAGLEVEPAGKVAHWDLPYAGTQEFHELIWGRTVPQGG